MGEKVTWRGLKRFPMKRATLCTLLFWKEEISQHALASSLDVQHLVRMIGLISPQPFTRDDLTKGSFFPSLPVPPEQQI